MVQYKSTIFKVPPENFNIPDVNEFIEPENPVLPDGITSLKIMAVYRSHAGIRR
jgi:hypothetical protein